MKTYSHIFFDLDRTLWDFEANTQIVLSELFCKYGLDSRCTGSCSAFIRRYQEVNEILWGYYREGRIGKNDLRLKRFHLTLQDFGVDDIALSRSISQDYICESPKRTALIEHTHDTLAYLKRKYVLSIITNGFDDVQHLKLRHAGLSEYFASVITSDGAGAKKPDASIFRHSLEAVNAMPERSLMVGDHLEIDIVGARSAGLDQVFFNPGRIAHTEKVTYEIASLDELTRIL